MSKTKPDSKTEQLNRRGFLRGLGTGAVGAATVVAGVGVTTPVEAAESAQDKTKARYKESEHVKKFYATNRYL
jgi:hypothetical protein